MINPHSQAGRLLKYLQDGGTITRLQAFNVLGIVELSSRCIDLERAGYIVNRKRIKVTNRFNEAVSVTEYSIGAVNV